MPSAGMCTQHCRAVHHEGLDAQYRERIKDDHKIESDQFLEMPNFRIMENSFERNHERNIRNAYCSARFFGYCDPNSHTEYV